MGIDLETTQPMEIALRYEDRGNPWASVPPPTDSIRFWLLDDQPMTVTCNELAIERFCRPDGLDPWLASNWARSGVR